MNHVTAYFAAESAESLLFMFVGALALGVSAYFVVAKRGAFFKGMAVPLVLVGLIQIVVGTTVYLRCPHDIARVQAALKNDPAHIQSVEIPRMKAVVRNFDYYRWTEMGLLLVGVALFALCAPLSAWRGVGAGLTLQAGLMLALDYFAEQRAAVYLMSLG
jgi:hypothetical protein